MVSQPKEGTMKRDREVLSMLRERAKGRTQAQAAARAGMSVRTARTYERRGRLPSQRKQPRAYRTRPNPFEDVWPWAVAQLERRGDPALRFGKRRGAGRRTGDVPVAVGWRAPAAPDRPPQCRDPALGCRGARRRDRAVCRVAAPLWTGGDHQQCRRGARE